MPHTPIQNSCWEEEKREKTVNPFYSTFTFCLSDCGVFVTQMVLCRYPGQVYVSLFLSNNIQCVIWFEFKKSFHRIQTCTTFVVDFGQLRITVCKILQDIWTSPSILSCLVLFGSYPFFNQANICACRMQSVLQHPLTSRRWTFFYVHSHQPISYLIYGFFLHCETHLKLLPHNTHTDLHTQDKRAWGLLNQI